MSEGEEQIRIACIGDSITFGFAFTNPEDSYPAVLQTQLGEDYEVRNFGNSGRCVIKSSRKEDEPRAYFYMKEHQAALDFKPHVVICNLGINDLMDYDEKSAEFVPDYKELLTEYRKLETNPRIIVWQKLAPLMEGQLFYGSKNVALINDGISEVVKELNKQALNTDFQKIETLDMSKPLADEKYFLDDHLHPNELGAKKIAEVSYNYLNA